MASQVRQASAWNTVVYKYATSANPLEAEPTGRTDGPSDGLTDYWLLRPRIRTRRNIYSDKYVIPPLVTYGIASSRPKTSEAAPMGSTRYTPPARRPERLNNRFKGYRGRGRRKIGYSFSSNPFHSFYRLEPLGFTAVLPHAAENF